MPPPRNLAVTVGTETAGATAEIEATEEIEVIAETGETEATGVIAETRERGAIAATTGTRTVLKVKKMIPMKDQSKTAPATTMMMTMRATRGGPRAPQKSLVQTLPRN
ncbi:hypothetical protein [Roseibium denhamense]|uniref:Uncharacterized protein n=1 Tax=Roseibium denhamense TaxID=76305 RepID=A0ABY1PAW0_9HYPH|nr:hypothetical protein [Roseibium denhamense]SMP30400.1 hypothetical protein SAMN06265374_3243 [Roseibium denhamense]